MNKLNSKEEEFRDILGGLEIDIDTNDLWANIESDLPQPKKKRRFGIFFIVGLISLGLIAVAWSLSDTNIENIDSPASVISTKVNSNTRVAVKENNATDSESNTNIHTQVNTNGATNNNKSAYNQITKTQEIALPINTESPLYTNAKENDITTVNSIEIDNSPAIVFNTNDSEKTNIETALILNTYDHKVNGISKKEERIHLLTTNLTPTLSSQLLEIAQRQRIESSQSMITPLQQINRQLILQLKLGGNRNITSISDINSNGEFDGSEFDFERDRLGLSGTFNIGVENKGWRFLAGISYHHHVSTYERDDIIISKNPDTGIEYYKISTDGNTTVQNGTVTVTSVRNNAISYHRQHKALDFHASIGKRLWSYKGFILMADAGLGTNVLTSTSGYYLADKDFGFTKITEDNHPYKINTHWNAIASLELGYDFGQTRVGISPFVRYNPNSITTKSHIYSMKNSQVGMQLSLTYTPTRE